MPIADSSSNSVNLYPSIRVFAGAAGEHPVPLRDQVLKPANIGALRT
jgi:hypothetical protein